MKTNKKNTFEALDSYFLNTESMTMNIDYFLDCINTQIDVVFRSDKNKREYIKTAKITAILWAAFTDFTNDILQYNDYNTVCTSQQLKDYLKQYGQNYDIFKPLYKAVEQYKQELKEV